MARLGDMTDHRGKVIQAAPNFFQMGINIALDSHAVECPKCGGVFPIIASGRFTHKDKLVAYISDRTACGTALAVSSAPVPTHGMDGQPVLVSVHLQGSETLGRLKDYRYLLTLRSDDALPLFAQRNGQSRSGQGGRHRSDRPDRDRRKEAFRCGPARKLGGGQRAHEITSLVSSARIVGEDGRSIVYKLKPRPWLYKATMNQDCRKFQNMDVVQITDAGLDK